jgi:hypothetical protein
MRRHFETSLVLALLLATAACSNAETEDQPGAEVTVPANADDVLKRLTGAGLPVKDVEVLTVATDSNHLMGRPGQYTSKADFYDARHPKAADGSDDNENTVEVFPDAASAKARHDYIDQVTKGVPMLLQYQLLRGNVLIRFDKVLLPAEVEAYKQALNKAVPAN